VPVAVKTSRARLALVAVTWKVTTAGSCSQPSFSTSLGMVVTCWIWGGRLVANRIRTTVLAQISPLWPEVVVRTTEPVEPEGDRKAISPTMFGEGDEWARSPLPSSTSLP
jgi:hypothetical protein